MTRNALVLLLCVAAFATAEAFVCNDRQKVRVVTVPFPGPCAVQTDPFLTVQLEVECRGAMNATRGEVCENLACSGRLAEQSAM